MGNESFELPARLGKALSNKNRLKILNLLLHSAETVESLAQKSELTMANVSKHLQVLLKAGVVTNERDKNHILYQIANPVMTELLKHLFMVGNQLAAEEAALLDVFLNP